MQNLSASRDQIKATAALSNSAKLLAGYMKATGVSDAKTIADDLDIPLRTVQRLKLDIAVAGATCANDATRGVSENAKDATDGADKNANSANCAMGGVSECANDATGGASQKEIPPIPPKEKTTSPSSTVEIHNLAQQPRARESAALPADLSERLIEACNGSLDNPANRMGLLNLSTPMMWLNQGCDLELDVLPTLRAAGQKYHGKRIRDWSYFTGMVADAKAKRERGMPTASFGSAPAGGRVSPARAVLEARKAREVHA